MQEDVIKDNKKLFEAGVIALFIVLFLFVKLAQPWQYSLAHQYPSFYNANDNFINGYVIPQDIKETGNYMYEPSYLVGGYKNLVGFFPPIFYQLTAEFSAVTVLQTYDASYILAIFISITTALIAYFIIRKYSPELALLSLPFMLGAFNFDFEIARAFGLWMYLTGTLFFVSMVWIIDRISSKYSFLFFAIFFSGAILGHPPEAIFSIGFLVFYLLIRYLKEKKLPRETLKNLGIGMAIALLISSYYLLIFRYALMHGATNQYKLFSVMTAPDFAPNLGVKLWDFGIIFPVLIIGLLIAIKKLVFRKKEEIPFIPLLAGVFALIVGYSNYLGMGIRAWQTRTSWPFMLAIFSGIVLFYIWQRFAKDKNTIYIPVISLALLLMFATLHVGQLQGMGIVDKQSWGALMWIKNNTPQNAKVYYYPMPLATQQFALWSAGRVPYIIDTDDYVNAAKQGIVKDDYKAYIFAADGSNSNFAYRASLTQYYYLADNASVMNGFLNKSSRNADYHVLQIGGPLNNPYISQYNQAIRARLLNSSRDISEVFNNGVISILKKNE
ncbi:Uncharacterised protein [uncultured archaeon]|nr:Uncharacterised protein [uncultured archaeon]